jgi:CRP/FNR family transcriptional regulator, cyclic AMP receptor protein
VAKQDADLDQLGKCQLFAGVPDKQLRQIKDMTKEISFSAGQDLTEEGSDAGRFYLILEGEVDVSVHGRHRRTLGPGDSVGEYSLLDGGPRSATVVAKTPVRTLSLASWNFKPLLAEQPSLAEAVIVELCRRLRETEAALTA